MNNLNSTVYTIGLQKYAPADLSRICKELKIARVIDCTPPAFKSETFCAAVNGGTEIVLNRNMAIDYGWLKLSSASKRTMILGVKHCPGDCPRHEKIAMELNKRGVDPIHVFETELISSKELQAAIDGDRDYKATPFPAGAIQKQKKATGTQKKKATIIEIKPTINPVAMPEVKGGEGVLSKAICLTMDFGLFGNTRQVDTDVIDIKIGAEIDDKIKKNRLRAQKRLLNSPELDAVRTFDYYTRKHVRAVSLPYDVGLDLVPHEYVPGVDEFLEQRAKEREEKLVPAFLAAYPAQCEAAAIELGSQYNQTDYKTLEQVRAQFVFRYKWIRFGVPGELKHINKKVWEKAGAQAAADMAAATEEMRNVLRAAMLELVNHMVERLKEDEEGKPLKFHGSTVHNLAEFLGNADFRNITDDAAVKSLVKQARELLTGVDVDSLKEPGAVRDKVKTGFSKIAATLDTLTVKAGGRKFRAE